MKAIFFSFFFIFFTHLTYGQGSISVEDIQSSEKVISLHFTQSQEDSLLGIVNSRTRVYDQMHKYWLDNSIPVTMAQHPLLPGYIKSRKQLPVKLVLPEGIELPVEKNDLAFYSISQLASLMRNKKITSVELTRFFIDRLKKFGDTLHCVISITEDIAMREAAKANKEMAEGNYRGLLQGIPYGLKDLFAVRGTRTTWGAAPYKNQVIDNDSYVYSRLKEAGAVLISKLSMGALAMNDYWFGGETRNSWKMSTGSSGSSAGSAAATVAGLVPFAIGTETFGSIISPSTVCGATALRPTFGSISISGAMTLAWSLDKAGPICRSAEDAAIVFNYPYKSTAFGGGNVCWAMPGFN